MKACFLERGIFFESNILFLNIKLYLSALFYLSCLSKSLWAQMKFFLALDSIICKKTFTIEIAIPKNLFQKLVP